MHELRPGRWFLWGVLLVSLLFAAREWVGLRLVAAPPDAAAAVETRLAVGRRPKPAAPADLLWLLLPLGLAIWAGQQLVSRVLRGRNGAPLPPPAEDRRFRALADAYPAFLGVMSPDLRYVFANAQVRQQSGGAFGPEFLVGKHPREILPAEDLREFEAAFAACVATGQQQLVRVTPSIPLPDVPPTADIHMIPLLDLGGRVLEVMLLNVDKTEQTQANLQLLQREAELHMAQRITGLGSWVQDLEANEIRWSEEMFRLHGLDPAQGVPDPAELARRMHDPAAAYQAALAATQGQPYQLDMRLRRFDTDEWVDLQVIGQPQRNAQGEVVRVYGTALNITERRRAAQHQAEQQLLLETITTQLPKGSVFILDRELRVLYTSGATYRDQGIDPAEFLGKTEYEILPPEQAAVQIPQFERVFATGEAVQYRARFRQLEYQYSLVPLRDASGNVDRLLGAAWDITETVVAERNLAEREALLSTIMRNLPEGVIFAYDRDYRIVFAEGPVYRAVGIDPATMAGKTLAEVVGDVGAAERKPYYERVFAGETVQYELDFHGRRMHYTMAPVYSSEEDIPMILAVAYDITERVHMEHQVRASQQQLHAAFESMGDVLVVLDKEWRFLAVNRRWEELFGLPRSAALGQHAHTLFPPDEPTSAIIYEQFRQVASSGQPAHFVQYFAPLGRELEIDVYPQESGGISMFFRDITERLRAERAERESQHLLALVGQNFPNGAISVFGRDMRFVLVAGQEMAAAGFSSGGLRGVFLGDVYGEPYYSQHVAPNYQRAWEGQQHQFELYYAPRNKLYSVTAMPLTRDPEGQVTQIVSVLVEITERRAAENALRAQQRLLSEIVRRLPDTGVAVVGRDMRIEYIDGGQLRQFDFDPAEMVGRPVADFRTPEQMAQHLPYYEAAFAGQACEFENEYRGRYVHYSYLPLPDSEGRIERILTVTRDVTEERNSRRLLEQQEELQRLILSQLPGTGVGVYDREMRFVYAEGTNIRANGLDPKSIVGRPLHEFVPPSYMATAAPQLARAWRGERVVYENEYRGMQLQVTLTPLPNAQGDIDRLLSVTRDVSEERASVRKLQESAALFRNVAANFPSGSMAIVDRELRFVLYDGTSARRHYTTPQMWEGKPVWAVMPDPTVFDELFRPCYERAFAGEQAQLEFTAYDRNLQVYFSPLPDLSGGIAQVLVLSLDVTPMRQAELALAASLREKEVLLAEIHHRVKNNLAIISGLLLLQGAASANEELKRGLQDSRNRIQAMALVHEKLYRSENLAHIDLDEYLQELVASVADAFANPECVVQVHYQLAPARLPIEDCIPCGLLVTEIVTNAMKHAFVGRTQGSITVALTWDGEQLVLDIADDGVGMPAEPAGTADAAWRGSKVNTGSLGRKLIRGLSRQIGAALSVQTSAAGTRYRIVLPNRSV